jgi:hypothetical protein
MRKALFGLAVLAIVASGSFASMATVRGADHGDSPLNMSNPTADINDVYAFRSPENNNLVVAISANPRIAPSDNATRGNFDPTVQFQIHVDGTGDLRDEATVTFRVTSSPPTLIVEGLGAPIAAPITPPGATSPMVKAEGNIKLFAGLRDDPFFFDLAGFQAFVANPRAPVNGLRAAGGGAPVDSFAGSNILAIVLELPVTAVTGASNANTGTIRTWVSSTRGGNRIDRMAIPAINTALIPSAQKDAFNAGDPADDATRYRPTAITTIRTLRTAVDGVFGNANETRGGGPLGNLTPEEVGGALIPDVVTIDFSKAVQFPNGRRLQDDVIDAALGVVLNRGGALGISDAINANDRPFGTTFPYLAAPHTTGAPAGAAGSGVTGAVPAGAIPAGALPSGVAGAGPAGAVRPPSTGDGNLLDDSGAMWTLSAAFFLLAVAFGSAGVFAAMRRRG